MKLEVGMYVRTQNNGIAKIKSFHSNIYDDYICISYYFDLVRKKEITKASHNIIDLIEVGDYVNGHRVEHIDDCKGAMREFYWFDEYETSQCGHYFEDIKSIVTKEQFSQMEYKVGE